MLDPLSGRAGLDAQRGGHQVYLRLAPGESILLRTQVSGAPPPDLAPWHDATPASPAVRLEGNWQTEFLEGGPELPESIHPGQLRSWTDLGGEVTNLAANRIRDLDRRRVDWKIMHETNFVNLDYQPMDASAWPVADSGLLGPVTLTPLRLQQGVRPIFADESRDSSTKIGLTPASLAGVCSGTDNPTLHPTVCFRSPNHT